MHGTRIPQHLRNHNIKTPRNHFFLAGHGRVRSYPSDVSRGTRAGALCALGCFPRHKDGGAHAPRMFPRHSGGCALCPRVFPEAHPTFYLLPFTFHLPEAFGRVRPAPSDVSRGTRSGAGHCPEAHPAFYLLPFTFHLPEAFGRVRPVPSGVSRGTRTGAGHCPEAHPTFYLLPFTFHLPEVSGWVRSSPSGEYPISKGKWWRRGELNSRPKQIPSSFYARIPPFSLVVRMPADRLT